MQRDLVEAAQQGDHEAFEVLATSAVRRLYAFARLVLSDPDQADEAVQEALVRAWQNLPDLRDPDRWEAWLHRLIVNTCADQGRRRQRRQSVEVRMIQIEPTSGDHAYWIGDHDQLERGFKRLKPEQRAAVVLRYYLDLTVPEVADALGLPVGTAKSKIHYAIETLRAALEADDRASLPVPGEVAQ